MPLNRTRLLELAAERLEAEKQRIDEELAEIRSALEVETARPKAQSKTKSRKRTRRKMTTQERKARSDRMKKYWAERKKKEKQASKTK